LSTIQKEKKAKISLMGNFFADSVHYFVKKNIRVTFVFLTNFAKKHFFEKINIIF